MTKQPEKASNAITDNEKAELSQPQPEKGGTLGYFLLGVFFGAIPVGVGLDISSYMTHTPWLEYEVWKLAIAAMVPLTVGILGVVYKGKFLDALGNVMSTTIVD